MKTSKNYGAIAKAITTFDACVSGNPNIPNAGSTSKYGRIISKLIEAETTGIHDGIDDYIMNTFHAFVLNKKEIHFSHHYVMKYVKDKVLLNNILVSPKESYYKDGETEFIRREATDRTNLFQSRLIKLFKNATSMRLGMNGLYDHENMYTLSLIALLDLLDGTEIKEILITWRWKEEEGVSWIETLWNSFGGEITAKYEEKGYKIEYRVIGWRGSIKNRIAINKL